MEAEIHRINPRVKTKSIVTDFAGQSNIHYFRKLVAQLEGLEISIAYINAGVMPTGQQVNLPCKVM